MAALRTWLQLLRAPNLFTAPGDPLAGYLLANSGGIDGSLAPVVLASVCLYGAGLLQNDWADEAEDRRERPNRPLPSGAARPGAVVAVAAALGLAGLGLALFAGGKSGLLVAASLIVAITLYNLLTKGWPVVGALNMGACRGLSVMLGATAGPLPFYQLAIPVAVLLALYIASVTNLARHEVRPRVPVLARLLPVVMLALIAAGGATFARQSPDRAPVAWLYLALLGWSVWLGVKMFRQPPAPLPPLIGAHIRLLLPLQAAACFLADPWEHGRTAALVLLACWPLSRLVARRFYAS